MRAIHAVALLFVALSALTSCAPRGAVAKAVAPVTPAAPQPLSIPQTRVELPDPQPVDPAALSSGNSQEVPRLPLGPPAAAGTTPVTTPGITPGTTPGAGVRRASPAPVVATPAEPRGAIHEMIPPAELKRLQDQLQGRRREVNQILDRVSKRRVARTQQNVVTNIRNFLTLSAEAEQRNDIRQADALAERAQILARDLQNGK